MNGQVIAGGQRRDIDKNIRRRHRAANQISICAVGKIGDDLFPLPTLVRQYLALVLMSKYRLDPRGDIVREQGNRAGRRDRCEQGIANPLGGNRGLDIRVEALDGFARQIGVPVKQRESAFLARELGRRQIGSIA